MLKFFAFIGLLALCTSGIDAQSAAASPERQRTAVLMAYMLRGSHHVRYETMTMPDQKGMAPKNADGTNGCIDTQGKERKNGEEYERPSHHFVVHCNNGAEEIKACIGSKRANGAKIEVGQNLDVGGFWHKCQSFENGSVVYTEEASCRDPQGKELRTGDEFTLTNLRFVCDAENAGFKVIGCSYKDQAGQVVTLNAGENREDGKLTHTCEEKAGTVQYSAKGSGCARRGKEYKEGDKFQENHLKYECKNGIVDITGCYVTESKDLAVGQDFTENGMIHRCYRLGGTIEYAENQCAGDSCHPPPVDSGPDDVPALGRGLQAPGVASFSVVSSGSPPQGIKLDLDKVLMGQQQAQG